MRRLCFLVVFLGTLCIGSDAQSLKDILSKGDSYFKKKDYENSLNTYLQAYTIAPDDAETNFKVGVSYLHSEKKSKALEYIKKAYETKPDVDLDIDYHLAQAYQYDHKYEEAITFYENFRNKNKKLSDIANHKISECMIGDSLLKHPTYVEIKNAGNIVNSSFHEYSPLLTSDGTVMIFTSNRAKTDKEAKEGTNYEDIYITRKTGEEWSEPDKISDVLNHEYHDAACSISPDGKTLFLYYEEGAGDIYISQLQDDGSWSTPTPLNKNINSPHSWETSACISADGQKLYFTSNRPGGLGELDIYVSTLDSKGNWGKAVNLGPEINTEFHEDSPFIHADGVTLFFSSDGHPSMGSNDIFKSVLTDGKWSKPENLGYPINSIDYDGFFILSADKKTGYYSAMREDGMGNADIFVIKFLDPPPPPVEEIKEEVQEEVVVEAQPEPENTADYIDPIIKIHRDMKVVTVLKGTVIDETTSSPIHATISLVNNETNQVVARITSKPGTGEFELTIPHGGNYGVATEATGYLFNSINFNLPQFAEYQEIDTHILMVKAEVGSKVVLKNIFFDTGKSDIRSESLAELEKIHALLLANPYLKVQINGHTDNTGAASANMALSLQRAEAVVTFLVGKGIERSRVSGKGFGSERPLVSNDDEQEGREINRRTEIEIIEAGHG